MGEMLGLSLGTLVLIVGIFIVIVGIIMAGVVYRESREWKKMVLPMFDREPTEIEPESPKEAGGLTPRMAACLLYTSPSPRDRTRSRMPSSA